MIIDAPLRDLMSKVNTEDANVIMSVLSKGSA